MSRGGYQIRNQEAAHFITFAVIQKLHAFKSPEYCQIVVDSLNYCIREKGLIVHAWVIMSNHVHFVFRAETGYQLSDILRDFKKHTSTQIIRAMKESSHQDAAKMLLVFRDRGGLNPRNEVHQFWQQENHPIELDYNSIMDQKIQYIHNNPVKAGIVESAEDYLYSSAIDYAGGQGAVKVEHNI